MTLVTTEFSSHNHFLNWVKYKNLNSLQNLKCKMKFNYIKLQHTSSIFLLSYSNYIDLERDKLWYKIWIHQSNNHKGNQTLLKKSELSNLSWHDVYFEGFSPLWECLTIQSPVDFKFLWLVMIKNKLSGLTVKCICKIARCNGDQVSYN